MNLIKKVWLEGTIETWTSDSNPKHSQHEDRYNEYDHCYNGDNKRATPACLIVFSHQIQVSHQLDQSCYLAADKRSNYCIQYGSEDCDPYCVHEFCSV